MSCLCILEINPLSVALFARPPKQDPHFSERGSRDWAEHWRLSRNSLEEKGEGSVIWAGKTTDVESLGMGGGHGDDLSTKAAKAGQLENKGHTFTAKETTALNRGRIWKCALNFPETISQSKGALSEGSRGAPVWRRTWDSLGRGQAWWRQRSGWIQVSLRGITSGSSWWKWKLLSHIQLFVTPWTIQSVEFSRPEYWNGYPFPSPGGLPNPEIKPRSPTLQADSLPVEPWGKPKNTAVGSLSQLKRWTRVPCIAGQYFTSWIPRDSRGLVADKIKMGEGGHGAR